MPRSSPARWQQAERFANGKPQRRDRPVGAHLFNKRVTGPDVWLYRWWEPTSDGRRTRRGFTVGTVEQYKREAHALKAGEGMRLMINHGIARREPVLFLWPPRPFSSRSETEAGSRTNHSQESSLLPKHDLPTHPTQVGRRLPGGCSAGPSTGLASQARRLAQLQGTYSVPRCTVFSTKQCFGNC
jgi:hypothetical protein